jgi:protein-L-isoaspartate O-methyltransferase
MKLARKIMVKTLGLRGYLKTVSRTYISMIRKGKMKEKYTELYFINKVVNEGDTVLDIGANLAYYSFFMSKNVGATGRLLAVEPIPLFAEIWEVNMAKAEYKNFKLFNCALGNKCQFLL